MVVEPTDVEEIFESFDDSFPHDAIDIETDERLSAVATAVATVLNEYEKGIERTIKNSAAVTAEGKALDRLAEPLGVRRFSGEEDDVFRQRLLSAHARSISDGTLQSVADVTLLLLEADRDQITFLPSDFGREEPIIVIETQQSAVADSPVPPREIGNLIADSVPLGHGVAIRLNYDHIETVVYNSDAHINETKGDSTGVSKDDARSDRNDAESTGVVTDETHNAQQYDHEVAYYDNARYQAASTVSGYE